MNYLEEHKKWEKKRDYIFEENQKLIRKWRSIPWWKFWVKRLTFEEERDIIINNWKRARQ